MRAAPFRRLAGLLLLLPAACGPAKLEPSSPAGGAHGDDRVMRLSIVQNARCGACHALGAPLDEQLSAPPPRPLHELAAKVDPARALPDLRAHYAGDAGDDVRAWLASLPAERAPRAVAEVPAGAVGVGERLAGELACGACHTPASLDLSASSDHASLSRWLAAPSVAHVPLSATEASAIAAWLLRGQLQQDAPQPGFAYECFELQVAGDDVPDLAGRDAAARGVCDRMHVDVRSRDEHFALRFRAAITVPQTGEWTFTVGSDDGSWLWIDGELLVDNGGQKPHTEQQGRARLTAGAHQLEVVYTQAEGGKSLEVQWQGPGVEQQELPAAVAQAAIARLVPPSRGDGALEEGVLDEGAVARGRAAARAARCDACHAVDDAAFASLPAPPPAKPWRELDERGACPLPTGPGVRRTVGELDAAPLSTAVRLQLALQRDGCLSCHVRDGRGGLPRPVQSQLVEVEDLGDEGRLPPDLTDVGRRLRPGWIERVVRDGHAARGYLRVRMPAFGERRAQQYAQWFAEVDAVDVVDEEPRFSAELAATGRALVGLGGRNCITCHTVQGHAALGPQGMDLAFQHERMRPGWLREWLWNPPAMRPKTRMQQAWFAHDDNDARELDAVLAWLSLGDAAPLPPGVAFDAASYELVPNERPILHGAFLKDVSARCLCVGTPERTHFAYDLQRPRLVWLWRGAFVDSSLTWRGRAGKLVEPLGADHVVVDDFELDGAPARRMLGQRRTDDGYPVLRVRAGDGAYEDVARPRLRRGGSELVRTITCTQGSLRLTFPESDRYAALVDGEVAGARELNAGEQLEVVYRW